MTVDITETFRKDMTDIMRRELDSVGFDTSTITDEDLPFKYFTVSLRTIQMKPRRIEKAAGFVCPPDLQNGLAILEDRIRKGESLFPHQSKSVNRLTTEDELLYSWSIHHFHLGDATGADGFIKRTGPVLFAYVTDDAVYMIDVKPHGSWSDKSLLQTLHDNWPELIDTWKVPGKPTVNLSSPQIAEMRKARINTIVELADGTSYIGPGLGITTAGTAAEATMKYNKIVHLMGDFIDTVKANPEQLLQTKYTDGEIAKMNSVQFEFSLRFMPPDTIVAVDKIHGVATPFLKQLSFLRDCK